MGYKLLLNGQASLSRKTCKASWNINKFPVDFTRSFRVFLFQKYNIFLTTRLFSVNVHLLYVSHYFNSLEMSLQFFSQGSIQARYKQNNRLILRTKSTTKEPSGLGIRTILFKVWKVQKLVTTHEMHFLLYYSNYPIN